MIDNKYAQKNIANMLKDDKVYTDIFILLGGLNKALIVSSIQILEGKLKGAGYPKTLVSRAKLIGIEILDNILKHQIENPSLVPYFEVSINHEEMKFTSGNCISSDDYVFLNEKLSEYCNLSQDGVKKRYMERLRNGSLDDEGNAGLGILTILKRAEKRYEYVIEKISEKEYFFNATVKIENQVLLAN